MIGEDDRRRIDIMTMAGTVVGYLRETAETPVDSAMALYLAMACLLTMLDPDDRKAALNELPADVRSMLPTAEGLMTVLRQADH